MSKKSAGSQYRVSTGVTNTDFASFQKKGNMLSAGATSLDPNYTTIASSEPGSFEEPGGESIFADQQKVKTLTDLFNKRIAMIKQKESKPGLFLTRGEK